MQAGDTDRVKLDDRCWSVQCANCNRWFEAARSDATYCSTRCRVHASRAPQRKLTAIADLQAMGRRANEVASTYKRSQDVYDQMVLLQAAIQRALNTFETDWEQLQLPD